MACTTRTDCAYFCLVSLGFADVSALPPDFVAESDFMDESDFTPVSAFDFASDEAGALVLGDAAGLLLLDGAADVSASRRPVAFRPCFCW